MFKSDTDSQVDEEETLVQGRLKHGVPGCQPTFKGQQDCFLWFSM